MLTGLIISVYISISIVIGLITATFCDENDALHRGIVAFAVAVWWPLLAIFLFLGGLSFVLQLLGKALRRKGS